ncbi:MAG: ThiF family adenylyltransferase [Gemmatimonadota bacterium]
MKPRHRLSLTEWSAALDVAASAALWESHAPELLRLSPGDEARFAQVCARHHLQVVDAYERQVLDLAAARFPQPNALGARERFVAERVDSASVLTAGTWVWYPWSRTVVHLLDEDEYFEVITNRNRDKLTLEEMELLRGKTVGVVGLSVGAEAAVTLAQEHLCGTLRIADFDHLDLSNLNRLQAGCEDLGLPKTTVAARRIARIDPYLRVEVFADGVTAGNLDDFMEGLDLLLDECDGLEMKLVLREAARARGIDVAYAGDERGFLSVEPYGRNTHLPLFHGRIGRAQRPRQEYASALDFWKDLSVWLGGWDGISPRSRQSLLQVGEHLCGYPQLASEIRLAAGEVGHVARRLLLGEPLRAQVLQIDLDALLAMDGESEDN